MSVADDPRLLAATPRPVPPPPPTGAGHPLHTLADAQRMRVVPAMRVTRHTRYAPAQWRDFYLTAMRRVDFAACSMRWGTTLAERFTSYMGIIRDTLVGIFVKPDDEGDMAVLIRCVNTVEELAEYDAELAQDAQRQAEAEATQAHIARMCLAHLDAVLKHCDAARNDSPPMLTCTNTVTVVRGALAAREATQALAKRTRDSGAPSALTTPQPPPSAAADAESVHAGAWRSWYYSVLGLKPGWLMALHHAKHADDDATREKQEAEITRLYFTNRQEAHARLRGSMLSVSPTLTATSLHEFYSDLATGSIISIDDAVRYVTRGAHHTHATFLGPPAHRGVLARPRPSHVLCVRDRPLHAGVPAGQTAVAGHVQPAS